MRISDWSSDVCSSDLSRRASARLPPTYRARTLRVKPQAAWLRRWWAALLRAQAWRDRLVLPDRQARRTRLARPDPPVLPLARAWQDRPASSAADLAAWAHRALWDRRFRAAWSDRPGRPAPGAGRRPVSQGA